MNTVSAKAVKEFCHVTSRDALGRPSKVTVPGHEGRQYEVIFYHNGVVLDRMMLETKDRICYHILSVVKSGHLARLGGRMFSVTDRRSGQRAWGVVRDET